MTYEYRCKICNHEWEAEQKITEAPLKTCPECNKESAQRLISKGCGGFILESGGCGWAANSYSAK